ncbi:hypothetical protein X975_24850, partial [Stegodyphus mimosarum]
MQKLNVIIYLVLLNISFSTSCLISFVSCVTHNILFSYKVVSFKSCSCCVVNCHS